MQHAGDGEKQRPMRLGTREGLIALLACVLAAELIFSLNTLLNDRITQNQNIAVQQPLLDTFPQSLRHRIVLSKAGTLDDSEYLGLRVPTPFYRAVSDGNLVSWLLPVIAREGYGGDIELVIAIDVRGQIIGVQVLQHRETTGLGDRIEHRNSQWLDIFRDHSLQNPNPGQWFLRADNGAFDGITGATVTTRAVTSAVKNALEFYTSHPTVFSNSAMDATR